MSIEEWVAYAKRFGTDEVLATAYQDGIRGDDLDRLEDELRALGDPNFKPRPTRRARRGQAPDDRPSTGRSVAPGSRKPGPRPRRKIPAEHQTGRVCEHCGRPLAGRADRRTCSIACRVALKRERDRQATPEPVDPPDIPIEEWTR